MKKLTLDLERILEESSYPAFILDRENRILSVNSSFCQLLGRPREDLEGKPCYKVIHGLEEPPSFCPLKEGEVCLLTGCEKLEKECPLCPVERCESPSSQEKIRAYRFKEFYEPNLKKFLRVTLFTLFDEKGEIFGYLHFIEDKTEEKDLLSLLQKVVDLYPGFFFVNDENFNILYMNEKLRRLCRKEDERCYEVIYGRSTPCEKCPLLIGEQREEEVYSPRLKKYFLRYFKIFKSSRGKIFKITFYTDITEQIRLFEEGGIPLVVTTFEGEILKLNRRARELFGVSELSELKNFKALDFWQNPEEKKDFLERLYKEGKVVNFEVKLKNVQGRPFFALLSAKVFEEDGKKLIYSAVEDITSYVKAKEEAYRFIERVLEFMPVGVAVIDEKDEVLYVNERLSEITGYSKEELKSANLHQLLISEKEIKERAKEAFTRIVRGETSKLKRKRVEFPVKRKDGKSFLAEIYFDEFYLEEKRLFIGLIQDITERKKLEERLFKEEKEYTIEKIAGGLAHDLNNILMVVKGYLELLREKVKEKGERELSYLEKVGEAFERMKSLVSELFILSRGEMKKEEWIEVSEFLRTWVPFYLKGTEIKVNLDLQQGLYLPMEEGHFLSLVQNLVINARDAMENVGELSVRAYEEEKTLVLEFEDSGGGIPQEYLEKIFEPGFSTKPQGTGLGLYVVKRIVELYGGKIEVRSFPNKGSIFILRFPLKERKEEIPSKEEEKISEREVFPKKKILILDDERDIREVLREFLEERGFEVETSENGDEALKLILKSEEEKSPFSAFLLDLTVPEGKGGIYLLKRLLSYGFDLSKYKIILMTGFTEKEVMKEREGLKIDYILYKPFSLESLLEVLS